MGPRHFALIAGGVVSNVIFASPEFADTLGSCVDITDLVPRPGIGWTYENGVFSAPAVVVPTPDADLATVKARAIDAVNAAAGASRVKFITDIPGQEATYQFKKEEMERYFATPDPSPAPRFL